MNCFCNRTLQWRHNGLDGVSNHQPHHCLLSRLFGHRSKKKSKLRVTGLCGTGEFPIQMASNAKNVSIWWRHHDFSHIGLRVLCKPNTCRCKLVHIDSCQFKAFTTISWHGHTSRITGPFVWNSNTNTSSFLSLWDWISILISNRWNGEMVKQTVTETS